MKIIKAPNQLPDNLEKSIMLCGTIDMGDSEDWQKQLTEAIQDMPFFKDCVILNPRRDDWDSSWEQTLDNEKFVEQVEWELNAMEKAALTVVVLLEDSKSPISLLEIGLNARKGKMIICCPEDFYRSGNVYITARKYNIPVVHSIEDLIEKMKTVS